MISQPNSLYKHLTFHKNAESSLSLAWLKQVLFPWHHRTASRLGCQHICLRDHYHCGDLLLDLCYRTGMGNHSNPSDCFIRAYHNNGRISPTDIIHRSGNHPPKTFPIDEPRKIHSIFGCPDLIRISAHHK